MNRIVPIALISLSIFTGGCVDVIARAITGQLKNSSTDARSPTSKNDGSSDAARLGDSTTSDSNLLPDTIKWVAGTSQGRLLISKNGSDWTILPSIIGNKYLWTVARGNGQWLATADDGQVLVSTDGQNWTSHGVQFPGGASVRTAVYGGAGNLAKWIVAGEAGQARRSTDAAVWQPVTIPFNSSRIIGLAFSNLDNSGSLWVAAGESGQMANSVDGLTWTSLPSVGTSTIADIATDGKKGAGVHWLTDISNAIPLVSSDGQSWTPQTALFGGGAGCDIATSRFDHFSNLWIVVAGPNCASGTNATWVGTSSNGTNWSENYAGASTIYVAESIATSATLWLMVGGDKIAASTDHGLVWTPVPIAGINNNEIVKSIEYIE